MAISNVLVDDVKVAGLPSGTVSLLFSDMEGSTALLSRLGDAYAEALDGQRRVLRKAWADHGGTELGTEGDSFYVVFRTALAAVSAAVQGQRELTAYPWPGNERVRVRMGIHTGSPRVHDGAYVGMDVHRAARIAGAAHGGQVVVSAATADLVSGCLPEGVAVKGLGSHRLKDIAHEERLFQVLIDGLDNEFPALKTLGTSSSLPRLATPLVGRDAEVAELAALLAKPEVRLVTLTGPGGSGKTRLAVGVAERLVGEFGDGVFFAPLAAATRSEVMWTTLGEVLDVPPERRQPPGLFEYVAHRNALVVLDNLEQLQRADDVVAELLDAAPQMVVVATSRRPLHLPDEHEHAVPPLEVPTATTLADVEQAGAVQMFVQQARKVKATFALSDANAADVATLCRRLDGLPLAIELAAARSKVLSPSALLVRLDEALDITAVGGRGPSRQKTLRDTIGWSYQLLGEPQQVFFRRLGVFSGGADLDAIDAVVYFDDASGVDVLDRVSELVDASLVTISENASGEPRVGMLETIRAYALGQLHDTGERHEVRQRHARYFLEVAQALRPLALSGHSLEARDRFETDADNLREALRFNLEPRQAGDGDGTMTALRLCSALSMVWLRGGYFAERRRWLEYATSQANGTDSPELARCLDSLAIAALHTGDIDGAHRWASASVSMWRRISDKSHLASALRTLASAESERDHQESARQVFYEALSVARSAGDLVQLKDVVSEVALFEADLGHFDRFTALNHEAITLAHDLEDPDAVLLFEHDAACILRETGRPADAQEAMRKSIPKVLQSGDTPLLVYLGEDYAAVLADLGDHETAVRLIGATDALRERLKSARTPSQQSQLSDTIAKTRAALNDNHWNEQYQGGRNTPLEDALREAHTTIHSSAVPDRP